ncbi:hypothetical protein B7494_g8145 [Chlorociboria aeruginascens]|nr:hypothetical protein B7494_g8145 [Chlorociboria aeruginascens]
MGSITTIFPKESVSFDPSALAQKYAEEKAKRLREDGVTQYQETEGKFAGFKADTFTDVKIERDAIEKDTTVLIVGGGFSGLVTAVRLEQEGVHDWVILEKGGGFGGAWYWNQYPGIQCDTESYIYLPFLEETGYMPKEKYVYGPEVRQHITRIVEKWDIAPRTYLQTEVTTADWDDEKLQWLVRTKRGDVFRSKFIVSAPGLLHKPQLPGFPGIVNFKRKHFHTGRWDYSITGGDTTGNLTNLSDKTVAIIGTGATAVQLVPILAQYAKKLYVFQRTPSSISNRGNGPMDENSLQDKEPGWQERRMDNFGQIMHGVVEPEDLVNDIWTNHTIYSIVTKAARSGTPIPPEKITELYQLSDFQKMEAIRARVDEIVKDKATAEKLKPWYAYMCKRPCFHDHYLSVFNESNVELIDTDGKGVDHLTETSVVAKGIGYEVDILIYSTGFELLTAYSRRTGITVTGVRGQTLDEKFASGPVTLFGLHIPDFPNFFTISTFQAGVSINFMRTIVIGTKHIAYVVRKCQEDGIKAVDPDVEKVEEWGQSIEEGWETRKSFNMKCTPGYYNLEGKVDDSVKRIGIFPKGAKAWAELLQAWKEEGGMVGLVRR